jgi:hypothetical protein
MGCLRESSATGLRDGASPMERILASERTREKLRALLEVGGAGGLGGDVCAQASDTTSRRCFADGDGGSLLSCAAVSDVTERL